MPICSMKQLLSDAEAKRYAVGAFSIINMETILGVIAAAEENNSPVILQIAEPRLKYAPISYIGPLMVLAAKQAKVPVCVHLDHAESYELIKNVIELGFTSVMIDASHFPLHQNIEITQKISRLAHQHNVDCEGEIGCLGLNEDGTVNNGFMLTDVAEAKKFAAETSVDAMAVAIGNQHGFYKELPKLNFTRLSEIYNEVSVPLVLHGGSGIGEDGFKTCIANGIRKINVATATVHNIMLHAKEYFANGNEEYFAYHNMVINAAKESVCKHIKIFGSDNKA